MREGQTTEMREMLPKAVDGLYDLYLDDRLNTLIKGPSYQGREDFWQETAKEFPFFSGQILGLMTATENAAVTKNACHEAILRAMGAHFLMIEDNFARGLLTDVLFARTIVAPGSLDFTMNVFEEANAMAKELGFEEGLRDSGMRELSLDQIIESILTGNLKLTRQTQVGEKQK